MGEISGVAVAVRSRNSAILTLHTGYYSIHGQIFRNIEVFSGLSSIRRSID